MLLWQMERHGPPSPQRIGSPAMDKILKHAEETLSLPDSSPSRGVLVAVMSFEPNRQCRRCVTCGDRLFRADRRLWTRTVRLHPYLCP